MPRPRKNAPRHFNAETLGEFIKTVREAQGMSLADVAREADVNRQAMYNLESGSNLPSIRTIEAICHQIGLDPIIAIEKGFGHTSGATAGKQHALAGRLDGLSESDLGLVLDFIDLLRARARPGAKTKRKAGHPSRSA